MLTDMTKSLPIKRMLTLIVVALRVAVGTAFDRVVHRSQDADALLAGRVRRAFELLGPTFVKAGQLISSSSGPLPAAWMDEMARCRDDVTPAPWEAVWEVLCEELGDRRSQIVGIDPQPLAAGSMAQVHTARLANGTPVVVKVQRPGLDKVLAEDIRVLRLAARLGVRFSATCAAANAGALVEEFASGLKEQMSFRTEAANAARMAETLRSLPVRIPAVYGELSSDRVLVMERLQGVRADDAIAIDALGLDRSQIVDTVVAALLVPALGSGVFHGDMHPGNMMVLADGSLGLLDFGVIGRLDGEVRVAASDLLEALAGKRFGDMVLALFRVVDPSEVDLAAVIPEVQSLVAANLDKPLAGVDVRQAITSVLGLAARNGFALPESLTAFFKQMVYISGMCQIVHPEFDLLADVAPIVGTARRMALPA